MLRVHEHYILPLWRHSEHLGTQLWVMLCTLKWIPNDTCLFIRGTHMHARRVQFIYGTLTNNIVTPHHLGTVLETLSGPLAFLLNYNILNNKINLIYHLQFFLNSFWQTNSSCFIFTSIFSLSTLSMWRSSESTFIRIFKGLDFNSKVVIFNNAFKAIYHKFVAFSPLQHSNP